MALSPDLGPDAAADRAPLLGMAMPVGPDDSALLSLPKVIIDSLSDGVYCVDRERRISYWNRGAERLTGYRSGEAIGRRCDDNLLDHVDADGRSLCTGDCPLAQTMADGRERCEVVWLRHAAGERRPVRIRTAPIRATEGGEIIGAVEIFSDAQGLVEAHGAAGRGDALIDPFSGLPIRGLLDIVAATRQDDLDRHRLPYGFQVVGIDDFAAVCEHIGGDVGDQAVRVVAATLRGAVRTGDTVVRWGPGEFGIIVAQADVEGMFRLAERLLRLVRTTKVAVAVGSIPVRVSIGGGIAHPLEAPDLLFTRAEQALAAARAGGGDRFLLNEPIAVRPEPRQFGVRW